MFSVKQVSDMSGRTERTIWRMIASGRLEHTKDGAGRVWIPEHAVPERRIDTTDAGVIAQMRAEISALRERIVALEHGTRLGTMRVLARPNETVQPSPRPPSMPPDATSIPNSMRGWGRWVENHGGARASGVRDRWHEVSTWSNIDEALEGIRKRHYVPQECTQSACSCHKALRNE